MAGKRELIKTKNDARYVRRDDGGRFEESDDVGRSLRADRQRKARTTSASGQGDKGDRRPKSTSAARGRTGAKRATGKTSGKTSGKTTAKKRTTTSKRASASTAGKRRKSASRR